MTCHTAAIKAFGGYVKRDMSGRQLYIPEQPDTPDVPPMTHNATYHTVGADTICLPITHRLPYNTVGADIIRPPITHSTYNVILSDSEGS